MIITIFMGVVIFALGIAVGGAVMYGITVDDTVFRNGTKVILICLALAGLSGCGFLNFPTLNAPKPPDQIYQYHQTIEKQPQVVQTAEGKAVVWEAQKQTFDVNYERKDKPLSFWQRICNWLANLGILGIVGVLAGLFFAPAGTIAWLLGIKNKFQKAFTQTVKAIDQSQAVAQHPGLKSALSRIQDSDVKAMVDDIQQPGK